MKPFFLAFLLGLLVIPIARAETLFIDQESHWPNNVVDGVPGENASLNFPTLAVMSFPINQSLVISHFSVFIDVDALFPSSNTTPLLFNLMDSDYAGYSNLNMFNCSQIIGFATYQAKYIADHTAFENDHFGWFNLTFNYTGTYPHYPFCTLRGDGNLTGTVHTDSFGNVTQRYSIFMAYNAAVGDFTEFGIGNSTTYNDGNFSSSGTLYPDRKLAMRVYVEFPPPTPLCGESAQWVCDMALSPFSFFTYILIGLSFAPYLLLPDRSSDLPELVPVITFFLFMGAFTLLGQFDLWIGLVTFFISGSLALFIHKEGNK